MEPTDSEREINNAYRGLVRKHHPDMGGSDADMAKLNEAKDGLKDPEIRENHRRTFDASAGRSESGDARNQQSQNKMEKKCPLPEDSTAKMAMMLETLWNMFTGAGIYKGTSPVPEAVLVALAFGIEPKEPDDRAELASLKKQIEEWLDDSSQGCTPEQKIDVATVGDIIVKAAAETAIKGKLKRDAKEESFGYLEGYLASGGVFSSSGVFLGGVDTRALSTLGVAAASLVLARAMIGAFVRNPELAAIIFPLPNSKIELTIEPTRYNVTPAELRTFLMAPLAIKQQLCEDINKPSLCAAAQALDFDVARLLGHGA
jgi:curved DNA-binding protein CbpA